jgi:hypothetical protein
MFSKLLEKLAGKAGLDNIRCDLERLKQSFRLDPIRASKLVFTLSDQICFAFANQVSRQDVKNIIEHSCQHSSDGFRQIVNLLFALDVAISDDERETALRLEQEMKESFLFATGFPLGYAQRTLIQKIAKR